jgi:hypothetical protein
MRSFSRALAHLGPSELESDGSHLDPSDASRLRAELQAPGSTARRDALFAHASPGQLPSVWRRLAPGDRAAQPKHAIASYQHVIRPSGYPGTWYLP